MSRPHIRPPPARELLDEHQTSTTDLLRSADPQLVFEAVALVDDFAADRVPVKLESKHDLTAAVNERVAHQLRKHKLQITQLFWLQQPLAVALHRASSDGGRGRIVRKGECDGDGHGSPCGRRAGTGCPSLLEHALQSSAAAARRGR